jgi:hypothetical protein
MDAKERQLRIIARGEVSNHCHVIVGDNVKIEEKNGEVLVTTGPEAEGIAKMRHLLETQWMSGVETWTEEHTDIDLDPSSTYKFIQQIEFNPLNETIERVRD